MLYQLSYSRVAMLFLPRRRPAVKDFGRFARIGSPGSGARMRGLYGPPLAPMLKP
jgi:hypothetical protein